MRLVPRPKTTGGNSSRTSAIRRSRCFSSARTNSVPPVSNGSAVFMELPEQLILKLFHNLSLVACASTNVSKVSSASVSGVSIWRAKLRMMTDHPCHGAAR